jgi:uncharacterized damage-inducible protein DinB
MNPYLLTGLETTAELLDEIASQFSEAQWDARPDPDRFSMREVCAHLSDWEPIHLGRMKSAVETPGGSIPALDDSKLAADHNYAATDPIEQMTLFAARRAETVEYIKNLTKEQMQSTTNHPERGELRTIDIAASIICHDLYHVKQLRGMSLK